MDLSQIGKEPIPGMQPAGADSRNEPEFLALTAEMEKLTSVTATTAVDWEKVVNLAALVISNKSKDIQALCYLCVGLMNTRGLPGLAIGVRAIRDMLENFWEDLFPSKKRMRGRQNALDWWKDKVRDGLSGFVAQIWTKEQRDSFINDLKAIDEFLAGNMPDAPILTPLIADIAAIINEESKEAPDAAFAAASTKDKAADFVPVKPASQAIAAPNNPPIANDGIDDPDKLIRQGLAALGKAAALLRKQDPFCELAFSLSRVAAWSSVTGLPAAGDGKTLIPAPDSQIVGALTSLYRLGNWKDLLDAAESRINEYLFWLDLNFYASQALNQLGRPVISEMIGRETFNYVSRLPGVEKLVFADGMPFALDETRQWLRNMKKSPSSGEGAKAAGDGLEKTLDQEMAEAMELIRQNQLALALNALQDKISAAASARERLIREIRFVKILIDQKLPRLIEPHLSIILQIMEKFNVEQWEPRLALEALSVVYEGLALQANKADAGLSATVFERIALLNPGQAMDYL